MKLYPRLAALLTLAALQCPAGAQTTALPDPTTEDFCMAVQRITANTEHSGANTVFTNMPAYRKSKPFADPHLIYQVVTYRGDMPIMVSCKVKGAAHLRSAYGEDAAGEQLFCPAITQLIQAQAVVELEEAGDVAAAAKAAAFVIDETEPYATGQSYLADFELSYRGDDGAIHINSPGLFHDYDSWTTWILPERFEGQVYCHIATVEYLKALATGMMEPGVLITTADDAPVRAAGPQL
jgi:hypothetical protein